MSPSDEEGKPQKRRSFVTDALQRISTRAREDDDSALGMLSQTDRRRLLQMCYLWPLTCCGFFLPLIVYVRFRHRDDVGLHARHGVVFSGLYLALALVMGLINGVVGRIVDDWVNVTFVCGVTLLLYAATLTALGLRWYTQAMAEESVEIPVVTGWAEKL